MSNGCLTGVALVIAILITMVFFSKKRVNNIETSIFKKMLFLNILESLVTILIVVIALNINSTFVLKLLNKIDVVLIITWVSLMFYYIYMIASDKPVKRIKLYIISLNIVVYFFAVILDVNIINHNGVLNSDGPLTLMGLIGSSMYILLMIVILLMNNKREDLDRNKYMPLYFFLVMMIVVAILRVFLPEINMISIVISLVDMIMIFTIENPDYKLLRQLQLIQNQMEKSNKIKSDFLSSMSHEIRTPLNAIVGYSQLIEYAESLEEAKENAKDIIDSSNILLNMYSNLLDIYRLEAEDIDVTKKEYDAKKEFNNLLNMFEYKMIEKKLKLISEIEDIPILVGDINIIKKTLINIIDNAIKYTSSGGITFRAYMDYDNKLTIVVEDTGSGIKKENMDKLFINFERLDYKDSNINGMGLGLSLARNLMELIGGSINIESEYLKGTKVTIRVKQEVKNESTNC